MNMEEILKEFLQNLGLSLEEIQIFNSLHKSGPISILQLSRLSGINRTKVYRLLDTLLNKGIIEEIVDDNRKLLKAADLDKLDFLLKEQEEKVKMMRELFPQVSHLITLNRSLVQPGSKVLFYRGREGIKQMVWNTL